MRSLEWMISSQFLLHSLIVSLFFETAWLMRSLELFDMISKICVKLPVSPGLAKNKIEVVFANFEVEYRHGRGPHVREYCV